MRTEGLIVQIPFIIPDRDGLTAEIEANNRTREGRQDSKKIADRYLRSHYSLPAIAKALFPLFFK